MIILCLIVLGVCWKIFDIWSLSRKCRQLEDVYKRRKTAKQLLGREEIIHSLESQTFDILVIGGGCVGTGCALDAASRGLKVGLIEAFDFGSQTSSKTTKLLHGGVRYLEKAIFNFSLSNFLVVLTALYERKTVMRMAPYLTYTVKIVVPICNVMKIPIYYVLLKIYDWLSINRSLGRSYLISGRLAKMYFGNLSDKRAKSAMVYHDGMMLDSRIVCLIAKTAAFYGATVANHVKLVEFMKNECGMITGARAYDKILERTIEIKCRMAISATGPFTDLVRQKNEKDASPLIKPSFGTHIVIKPGFGPENVGILDPCSKDGRVVFILPWQGHTLVGSTDIDGTVVERKNPTVEDVDFLLDEIKKYNGSGVTRKDVMSAWTGIRPLINDPRLGNTESIVRGFKIINENTGLISVFGGKWTTFRTMAEKAVDMAINQYNLSPESRCLTNHISIIGSRGYSRDLHYKISRILDVDTEYAKHLLNFYGDRSLKMKKYIRKYPNRLSSKYMFVEGEAIYCFEEELAMTALDVVNNRFEIGYYDVDEALLMIERVEKLLERYLEEKKKTIKVTDQSYKKAVMNSLGHELIQTFKNQT